VPPPALSLALALALCPVAARAGDAACWFEHGVVVAPAVVAGVAGDYILDTGAPATLLHETRAQTAGFAATALRGEVRLAGVSLPDRPVAVADLDARTWSFETPIAGVIGMDVLGGYVVDVRFAPCRVAIRSPREAGPFPALRRLALARTPGGLPVVQAGASDGPQARLGGFVAATGADAAVRLSDGVAKVEGAAKAETLYPYGEARPGLRALSFAGDLSQFVPAGLTRADALPAGAIGVIGSPILSRWSLRFDFPGRRLLLGAP